jgi:NDP-sugar pyrophosphorylase family protein
MAEGGLSMPQGTIAKAMLLAAGLGTRLRPLTLTTPKPLLPLDGALLIDHQLRYLRRAGIAEVMINLYHLGDQIRLHVGDGQAYGLRVHYSEEPDILGTGGGIKQAETFFGGDAFVALNADALIDADVAALVRRHLETGAAATMTLKEIRRGESYNPVAIDGDNFVTGFGTGTHFYTGLQVLGPEMLAALPPAGEVSCLVMDGYEKLLRGGKRVAAFIHRGYFNDLGTPERYDAAKGDVADGTFTLLR